MKQKIALYYDSLWIKGGAERVAAQLAKKLNADIITSGYNPELKEWLDFDGNIIDIGNPIIKINQELGILLGSALRFSTYKAPNTYTVHIFLGFNSIYAAKKENNNIWFCLTPNRMLYDSRKLKSKEGSFAKQLFFRFYQKIFTEFDQNAVKKINDVVAQTEHVQERIIKYYDRDSHVIYSPLDTNNYSFGKFGDFYLAVGRVVPEKRILLIAQAFTKMPRQKLIIVGEGPERGALQEIIKHSDNISYLGNVSEELLLQLYSTCLATIYMPFNEDYGLVPLEGMASGKICIGVNEGGCLETIKHNETGKIISPNIESICNTINTTDREWIISRRLSCLSWVKQFDTHHAIKAWEKTIESSLLKYAN